MSDVMTIDLQINGESCGVRTEPATTLLEVVRTELGLTGAKRGCNQGVCGACTVLLDGKPVRSCLTLAANVGERHVTTVEGLETEGTLSAIQQALIDSGAIQCGFCTPGIALTLEAFLRENPGPNEQQIRHALSGNLCRCSGYVKIVEAAVRAAGARP